MFLSAIFFLKYLLGQGSPKNMGLRHTERVLHSKGDQQNEPTEWEETLSNDTSNNGLISKICKYTYKPTSEKQKTQLKIGQRT